MATYVTLTVIDGSTVEVNPDEVFSLEPVPDELLPEGLPAGTYVNDGDRVAVEGTPAQVAALLSSGGGGTETFGPSASTVIVGNVPAGDPSTAQSAPFEYIPDIGDGAGIETAFASVAAGGLGGCVHIRRGVYDFGLVGSPALPLAIDGFRVQGDGDSTQLRLSTLDRRLFVMTTNPALSGRPPELVDVGVDWTTAAPGAVGTECIDALTSFRATLRNVEVIKQAGGPVLNPDESLTSLFRTGFVSRVYACRAQNIDGTAGGTVVVMRLSGATSELIGCSIVGGNIGVFVDQTVQGIFGCSVNGGPLFANHQCYVIDSTNVRIESCQAGSAVDGIVALAGAEAIITANNISGVTLDGIRIDAGAGDGSLVLGNRLNGNTLNILNTATLSAMNQLA